MASEGLSTVSQPCCTSPPSLLGQQPHRGALPTQEDQRQRVRGAGWLVPHTAAGGAMGLAQLLPGALVQPTFRLPS